MVEKVNPTTPNEDTAHESAEKRFVYKDDWEQEDMLEKESDNARTSREIGKVMNSIYRHIKFTIEIPEDLLVVNSQHWIWQCGWIGTEKGEMKCKQEKELNTNFMRKKRVLNSV